MASRICCSTLSTPRTCTTVVHQTGWILTVSAVVCAITVMSTSKRYEVEQDPENMSDAKLTCTRPQLASARWAKHGKVLTTITSLYAHISTSSVASLFIFTSSTPFAPINPCSQPGICSSGALFAQSRIPHAFCFGWVSTAIGRLTSLLIAFNPYCSSCLSLRILRPRPHAPCRVILTPTLVHSRCSLVISSHTSPPTLVQTPLYQSRSRFRCGPVARLSTRTLIRIS
ncbi:hypothetical protein BKA62DRAFT_51527 [Auriculariales sp. MPI-PUGE-AT-0066]|nr:hypothetical protein BKA62DRAFT_51527 [Auriculariales sp. MPI-PUGE-AT-0066]